MSLRTLLVYIDNESNATRLTSFAAGLAGRAEASLVGMHATPVVPTQGGYADVMSSALGLAFVQQQTETTARIRDLFLEAAGAANVSADWKEFTGFAVDDCRAVCEAAFAVDLVVVPQPDPDNASPFIHAVLKDLVCTTGRPILHMPRVGDYADLGNRLLIGWSPTREASRAVQDAVQLARPGAEATVLWVSHGRRHDPQVESSARNIAAWLATHDIEATVSRWENTELAIGDVLLNECSNLGSDLIVTGGYGHSRFYDAVIGATTTHLLEHMTAPVLFSH